MIRGYHTIGSGTSPHTHRMRAIGVKRALDCVTELAAASYGVSAPALACSFPNLMSITYRCGPCGVVGDALASSKRSGKSTGFCWPPTLPLARQCVLTALHGDECMDKLKRRCGQSEGSSDCPHLHAANGCTVKDRHLPRRR